MMGNNKRAIATILGPDPRDHKEPEGETSSALHECVSEFVDAIHNKDISAAVDAFRACFAELEAMPHEEYSQEE